MNKNYGTLSNGIVTYAPSALDSSAGTTYNPTAAQYLAAGYKQVEDSVPSGSAGEGKRWAHDGWEEESSKITRKWKAVDASSSQSVPDNPTQDELANAVRRIAAAVGMCLALAFSFPCSGATNVNANSTWGSVSPTNKIADVAEAVGMLSADEFYAQMTPFYLFMTAQTNAWFCVTNYEGSSGTPATMQLLEMRDGTRRTVWDQRWHTTNEIAKVAAATNALRAEIAAVSNVIPSAAWGARYPTGGENPATNEVWVSTPTTVISGGWEWQKNVTAGGALWLLRSNGIIADLGRGGTTNSAYLKITDWEGNEVLTVTKTSSVMVDALPDSCEWDEANGYFVVKYFKTDTQPIAYCKADVEDGGATFATAQMEGNAGCAATCTWTANANDWELHATPTNAAMTRLFVAATYERQGSTVIQNNAPIGVMGGMMVTNAAAGGWITVYPKWNGSTVTWGTTR